VGLPSIVRVKLSSEEAGYLSMTPVVVQEMTPGQLIELVVAVAGKDPERVADLLLRGSLVSGATRFRWEGFQADPAELAELLAGLPDAEPSRPFVAARCVRVVLSGPYCRIEISRQAGMRRRWLQRRSFWDALMEEAADPALRYREYSYKERADCYLLALSPAAARRLREQAGLLRYSVLQDRVRAGGFEQIEYYVTR
jgi:hypothetical protein